MQLKKQHIRNASSSHVKRNVADYDQRNNTHPVGTSGPSKSNRYVGLPAGDSSVNNNGRFNGQPRPCYQASFNPAVFKDNEHFPKINARAIVHEAPDQIIPETETRKFRGTARQYAQRGISVAPIHLYAGQLRKIQHSARMQRERYAARLRRIGIIQPTTRQVHTAMEGFGLDIILRMK